MADGNPFTPRFGAIPPYLSAAPRPSPIEEFARVADGDSDPDGAAALLLGTRGMGKTALLRTIEWDLADRGWLILRVAEGSTENLLDALTAEALRMLYVIHRGEVPRIAPIFIGPPPPDVTTIDPTAAPPPTAPDLHRMVAELGLYAHEHHIGLLVAIDEIQTADPAAIREFGNIFQTETSGEGLPIAFLAAGLLEIHETLLAEPDTTFLHRCAKYELGPLSRAGASEVLTTILDEVGGVIHPEALDAMLDAADGHPYMLQAIGAAVWDAADKPTVEILPREALPGINRARREMGPDVYSPSWSHLSQRDKHLLFAALAAPPRTSFGDLATIVGTSLAEAVSHCQRLIRRGFLADERGRVRFAHREARHFVASQRLRAHWLFDTAAVDEQDPEFRTIRAPVSWDNAT